MIYHMKANNRGRTDSVEYAADATGRVAKDPAGHFIEEFHWTGLSFNGESMRLSAGRENHQRLSLDPAVSLSLPDFSRVDPKLIGPMADLLTFYLDLWLAIRQGMRAIAGEHVYVKHGTPGSWADGRRTILGEDSIDLDFTVDEVDRQKRTARLSVRHVPPTQPQIKLPAKWMETNVADTKNNWVQVSKTDGGSYRAEVGRETFDVEITVDMPSGKILSANMDNPVLVLSRECADVALATCGNAERYEIRRQIMIQLEP